MQNRIVILSAHFASASSRDAAIIGEVYDIKTRGTLCVQSLCVNLFDLDMMHHRSEVRYAYWRNLFRWHG